MIIALFSLVGVVLFPFLYWYYVVYVKFRSFRALPGPKPIPIIGSKIANDSVGILVDMQNLYERYKPTFVIYTGPQVRVVHSKPEHIHYIVTSNAHTTKSDNFDVLKGWIGEGLATSKENHHGTFSNVVELVQGYEIYPKIKECELSRPDITVLKLFSGFMAVVFMTDVSSTTAVYNIKGD